MNRLPLIDPASATGATREVLDAAKSAFGMVPNALKAMAHSPAAAQAYLSFSAALGKGSLDAKTREAIGILISDANACNYCLAAHTAIGKMHGLSDEQATTARTASTGDARIDAVLTFARVLMTKHGHASDGDLGRARAAGLSDGDIAEVVANVALNYFTNYFNHVANPMIDFPAVPAA